MPPTKILKYSSHDFNLISFHKTRDTYNDNSPIQRAMRFHLLNLVLGDQTQVCMPVRQVLH